MPFTNDFSSTACEPWTKSLVLSLIQCQNRGLGQRPSGATLICVEKWQKMGFCLELSYQGFRLAMCIATTTNCDVLMTSQQHRLNPFKTSQKYIIFVTFSTRFGNGNNQCRFKLVWATHTPVCDNLVVNYRVKLAPFGRFCDFVCRSWETGRNITARDHAYLSRKFVQVISAKIKRFY